MAYRSWTHVALATGTLREAEEFYAALFGMQVAFRETETADGWRTLRGGSWAEARAAGIEPGLVQLRRDSVVLALEAADPGPGAGDGHARAREQDSALSHIGMAVDTADLAALRGRAPGLGCVVVTARDGLLIIDDPYGIRWEVSTASGLTSTGDRTGRWLDLPAAGRA
jgi:catechol 2,3-dioxygenase-like lactoylglutathione lyase family enzyme